MNIYTKTGDEGNTSLFDGSRVPKHHPRVEAYGTVDEANSLIGRAVQSLRESGLDELAESTHGLQHRLHAVCAMLANPEDSPDAKLKPTDVESLEELCDRLTEELPPLKTFILPGGSRPGSLLHHARTVCRRAERRCVRLDDQESLNPLILEYLNRLSDGLFMLARSANHRLNHEEVPPEY